MKRTRNNIFNKYNSIEVKIQNIFKLKKLFLKHKEKMKNFKKTYFKNSQKMLLMFQESLFP